MFKQALQATIITFAKKFMYNRQKIPVMIDLD
jgi:hypothetical protein